MDNDVSNMPNGQPRSQTELMDVVRALPRPEGTQYPYELVITDGLTAYVAGQIPKRDGALACTGRLGRDLSLDEGVAAARFCAEQTLAWLNQSAGGLGNLRKLLRLTCYVAHDETFRDISDVANGASLFLIGALGDRGRHVRSVIGVQSLPRNAPVLLEVTAALFEEVRPSYSP